MKAPSKRTPEFGRAKAVHPHAWLWEPLEQEPSFMLRTMFRAKALYLHGLLMVCFCAEDEPWRGMLVCTDRARHPSLRAEFPSLQPHSVLGKWLYLPESAGDFEQTAARLLRLAQARDPRLGVVPGTKKKRALGRKRRKPGSAR